METEHPIDAIDAGGPAESRRRWWPHLILLTLYPLGVGVLGALGSADRQGPLLKADIPVLLVALVVEMVVFGFVFLLAWLASRVTAEELLLTTWHGARACWRGLAYSVALRLLITVLASVAAMIALAVSGGDQDLARTFRPQHEQLVDARALTTHPAYFLLNLTVVSFLLGGLREEVWRAGMLAGWAGLFPRSFATVRGKALAISLAAVVFGLGHLMQGWGGVAMTTVLGMGLGVILVRHRSVWEAALAHGFFNATTFVLLYFLVKYRPEFLAQAHPTLARLTGL
jgi:membrane protease YdiL (CAAX protease family)